MRGFTSSTIWGIIILNVLGFFMDVLWNSGSGKPGYFEYRIDLLDRLPYWLFAILMFLTVNGIASIYFATVGFRVTIDEGNYHGDLPVPHMRFFGVNLILIPILLVVFLVSRAIRP